MKMANENINIILKSARNFKPRKELLYKKGGHWRSKSSNATEDGTILGKLPIEALDELKTHASKLLSDDVRLYSQDGKNTEGDWVLTSGTVATKTAALVVKVQNSPVHNLHALDSLLNMIKTGAKHQCSAAIDTVRDLFLSNLLPEGQKLVSFEQRSLSELIKQADNKDSLAKLLLLWYFEDQLKQRFTLFISILKSVSHDTVDNNRQKALCVMYQLLVSTPEQEHAILPNLINKLGDPNHKLGTLTVLKLGQLLEEHPNMKIEVVKEVERSLFRQGNSKHAQYYSVCFLTQVILSHEEKPVAARIVQICLSLFRTSIKDGEIDNKLMKALLTGVNRAFPFAKLEADELNQQLDMMYKVVHVVNFNVAIQAMLLIFQVLDSSSSVSDRFYTSLYRKLRDIAVLETTNQAMLLNLLFKAISKDEATTRVKALVKRILQICLWAKPAFVCGLEVMLSRVLKQKNLNLDFEVTFPHEDDEDEHYEDVDRVREAEQVASSGTKSSWMHKANVKGQVKVEGYKPDHRNPLFAGADGEPVFELTKLRKHFHPTAALYADNILTKDYIPSTGDPLQDHTLLKFLDRFVHKNPKKMIKPTDLPARDVVFGKRRLKNSLSSVNKIDVTSDGFARLSKKKVPVEEHYLHQFFVRKAAIKKLKADEESDDDDRASVGSAEFDELMEHIDLHNIQDSYNLDFAGEYTSNKASQKKAKKKKVDDADIDSEDEDANFDDEDFEDAFQEFESDIEEAEGFNDEGQESGFNEEDVSFSDDDFKTTTSLKNKKTKSGSKPNDAAASVKKTIGNSASSKKRRQELNNRLFNKKHKNNEGKYNLSGMLESAEKFSAILDETGASLIDTTTSEAMARKDNANVKQLQWEMDRDRRDHGRSWKRGKSKHGGKKGKRTQQKRPGKKHVRK